MAMATRIAPPVSPTLTDVSEHVVLLGPDGVPTGTAPKADVHGLDTPLHLAFSCHIVRSDGAVLLTRRGLDKPTWPGVWTNGCCGHPQLGETLREAVTRRLGEELGLFPVALAVALPDFTYRAEMDSGVVEHELCPVVIARVDGVLVPDPAEVSEVAWVPWPEVLERARSAPGSLSPWAVEQLLRLDGVGSLAGWLDDAVEQPSHGDAADLLDARITLPAPAPQPVDGDDVDPFGRISAPLAVLLERFLAERSAQLAALDPTLVEITDEIGGLVAAGGKRLRPAFVYWGHRAGGAAHDDEVLRPAAAVEMLHTFALLHDDVMDRSAVRRGRPSAHAALARTRGDEWFGYSAAILAGDLAYLWADELFDATRLPAVAVARARAVFTQLRSEVLAGQYLDLRLATGVDVDEVQAQQVALLKSARYTVTRPLLLGAALVPDVDPRIVDALRTYGDAVGVAFQLRDDVLGLFGDPAETGKSAVDDLREGKRTLLVLRAMRLADGRDRDLLEASLGDRELGDAQAERVRSVVRRTGALASVEARLASQHATALAALAAVPNPARSALESLAARAVVRRW